MSKSHDDHKTYLHFEGKPDTKGTINSFWIQDLTEEYLDIALKEMSSNYLKDEIIFGLSGSFKNQDLCDYFKTVQLQVLREKISLICLTTNSHGEVILAGLNSLYLCKEDNEFLPTCGDWANKIKPLMLIKYITSLKDPYQELGINEYLKSMGLYVVPEFRNCGIGQNLINARDLLCKELGIGVSISLFSSKVSQQLAEKAGYKDLLAVDYEDIPEDLRIPNLHLNTKTARYMYKIHDN